MDLPEGARLLLAIRRQRHWTQARLAVELAVSVRTLRRWETSISQPNGRDMLVLRSMLAQPGKG